MNQTHWLPGVLVLSAGVVIALAVLLLTRKKGGAPAAKDPKLADLEQRAQLLIEQLRALEVDKATIGEAAYAAEKSRLEREAADALRARDGYLKEKPAAAGTAATEPQAPAAPAGAARSQWLPAAVGALVGAFVVSLVFFLVQDQKPGGRGPMGGGPMMGAQQQQQQQAQQDAPDPMFDQALQRLKQDPNDLEAASLVAHELIRQEKFDEADKLTRKSLALDPFHIESRIHRAVLKATNGQFQPALDELGHLSDTYPDAFEALLFRGALAMQVGKNQLALESFERYRAFAPKDEQPPQLVNAIVMLKQQMMTGGK